MTLLMAAAAITAALLIFSLMAVAWRLLRGPSSADRVIAIDMLGLLGICVAALSALIAKQTAYLDVALGIAVFGFLSAVAFAGLLERGSVSSDESE